RATAQPKCKREAWTAILRSFLRPPAATLRSTASPPRAPRRADHANRPAPETAPRPSPLSALGRHARQAPMWALWTRGHHATHLARAERAPGQRPARVHLRGLGQHL